MKDVIQKEEIEKMNRYGKSYTIMLIATAVSAVPLFMWLGVWAFIPWGIIWANHYGYSHKRHCSTSGVWDGHCYYPFYSEQILCSQS